MIQSRVLSLLFAASIACAATPAGAASQDRPGHESQFIRIAPLPTTDRPGAERAAAPRSPRKNAVNSRRPDVFLKTVGSAGGSVAYRKGFVRGVGVNLIEVNLRDPRVKIGVMLAAGGVGNTESFAHMCARSHATAAITGTFFGLNNREPTGDIVIDGHPAWRGFIGTAVAITAGNRVAFIPTRYKDPTLDWSRYETVIRGGPALLRGRQFVVDPQGEGFFSLGEFARHWRTAVGVTASDHLIFLAVRQSITMWELAKIMYSLGAWDAVALDGGTSTAMYYGGKMIAKPGRSLTNVMVIYADRARYEAIRPPSGRAHPARTALVAPPLGIPAGGSAAGSGFEPAMGDPAAPGGSSRLQIHIEPSSPGR
jgi:hypothetical protein